MIKLVKGQNEWPTIHGANASDPTLEIHQADLSDARFHVVVNPVCGQGKASGFLSDCLLPILRAVQANYDVHTTTAAEDATRIAKRLRMDQDRNILLVLGGDGTLHELIQGFDQPLPKLEIVLIPLGTANALFHSLYPTSDSPFDVLQPLVAALEGKTSRLRLLPLVQVSVTGQATSTAHVVASTALHASILYDAESLRSQIQGIDRFKKAAQMNWGTEYAGQLRLLGNAKKYSPSDHELVDVGQDLVEEGPWMYLTGCLIDRLEAAFVIAPLRRNASVGTIDVVTARRDPTVDKAAFLKGFEAATVAIYSGGKHVDLVWEENNPSQPKAQAYDPSSSFKKPLMEYWRCQGFEWHPAKDADEKTRLICVDGSLLTIPPNGHARVEAVDASHSQLQIWC